MTTIREGSICYIVGSLVKAWNGRIVTTGSFFPWAKMQHVVTGEVRHGPAWEVFASWLPLGKYSVPPERLRPITDPDAPAVTDETEALDDEIQRVRHLAGLV